MHARGRSHDSGGGGGGRLIRGGGIVGGGVHAVSDLVLGKQEVRRHKGCRGRDTLNWNGTSRQGSCLCVP